MMDELNPYQADNLPDIIPVFPLDGVLLLPRGALPLNIFEPRYLAMVEDALKGDRLIGMAQPSADGTLYTVGCAGRITAFNETGDRRYLITLTGLSRFRIENELPQERGYRRVRAGWADFVEDLKPAPACLDIDRARLHTLLASYFDQQGLSCEWDAIDNAPDDRLINCLSMICPLEANEKQALLEAPCCKSRAVLFMAMLELAVCACGCDGEPRH